MHQKNTVPYPLLSQSAVVLTCVYVTIVDCNCLFHQLGCCSQTAHEHVSAQSSRGLDGTNQLKDKRVNECENVNGVDVCVCAGNHQLCIDA